MLFVYRDFSTGKEYKFESTLEFIGIENSDGKLVTKEAAERFAARRNKDPDELLNQNLYTVDK